MRLPSIRAAVGTYAAILLLTMIPRLFPASAHGWPRWVLVALSIPVVLTYGALFIASFSINGRIAVIVPVVGILGKTLLVHYLRSEPGSYRSPAFDQGLLRHELWVTIKFELLVALAVTGAAL